MKYPYTSRRIGATLVDYPIIFFLTWAYIYLTGDRLDDGRYQVTGLAALMPMAFWFIYFVIAERYWHGTFGHQLFKLKVVSMDGNDLHFGQVLVRRIFDVMDIVWCFGLVAFILVRSTSNNQRLGDQLAKTRVVGIKDRYPYLDVQFDFEQR
jgi:uncharacterized RDD family membrane protein YckC